MTCHFCFWLEENFASTNQKHYPDLGSDASSVWNFCTRFSDFISRGNQWWHREMSAGLFDWIVLFRIWFKRFLSPAHVTYWSCLWPLELMTSQVVQRTKSVRAVQVWMGFFVNCHCFHCNWKIWRDAFTVKQKSPYMSHLFPSCTVHGMQFCPFEDVLGVGHSQGFGSLLIPGKTCIFTSQE